MKNAPPITKYLLGLGFWMSLYAVAIVFNGYYFRHNTPEAPLVYILAVMPALPVGGTIWVILRFIEKSDEYMRALLTRRMILALGLTLFVCTAYGFLENYAGVKHFDLYLVWVLFWVSYGVVSPFNRMAK
jgi:hypothetical protein